jgi:hypothetical protein
VRGNFWVISVTERACGRGMSEQRGAGVVCMLILGEGWLKSVWQDGANGGALVG